MNLTPVGTSKNYQQNFQGRGEEAKSIGPSMGRDCAQHFVIELKERPNGQEETVEISQHAPMFISKDINAFNGTLHKITDQINYSVPEGEKGRNYKDYTIFLPKDEHESGKKQETIVSPDYIFSIDWLKKDSANLSYAINLIKEDIDPKIESNISKIKELKAENTALKKKEDKLFKSLTQALSFEA